MSKEEMMRSASYERYLLEELTDYLQDLDEEDIHSFILLVIEELIEYRVEIGK